MFADQSRRRFILRTLPAVALLPLTSAAQNLRDSARIINGYQGGGADVVSRKLAERLTGHLARSVIVENRTGAAGRIAVEAVKASPADGSVILITPASVLTMYPHIFKNLSYDVFFDLMPVSVVATFGFALAVGPAVPRSVETLDAFLSWCKTNPAAANCANPGSGSLPHFLAMMLAHEANTALVHVPFRGGAQAVQSVLGGQVSSLMNPEGSILSMLQSGLRVLATTGRERSPFLPQVPTFFECGYPRLVQREWYGAFMPGRTPPALISAAAAHVRIALLDQDLRDLWQKSALSAEASTPAELQHMLRTEYDYWKPVIAASGFVPET